MTSACFFVLDGNTVTLKPWEAKGSVKWQQSILSAGRFRSECDLHLDALNLDWDMEITFCVSGKRGDAV